MKTAFILCFFLLTAASQENGETSEDLSPKNGGVGGDADKVKSKEAAGREKHFHGDQHFESSTCSMEASYGLALNGDRFFCRDTASTDYDSCVACCVSATRIGTKVARKDVTGFLASNIIAGRTVCVCCIPNAFDEPYE